MYSASVHGPKFSIADLLSDFRSSISGHALRALEKRDDAWREENRDLRKHCRLLEDKIHEILPRSRWLENKLSDQGNLRLNMVAEFGKKEKRLMEKIHALEDGLHKVKRDHCEQVAVVASEKASVEEELKMVLGRLSKGEQQAKKLVEENLALARKIKVLEREKIDTKFEAKREGNDRIERIVKMAVDDEKERSKREVKKAMDSWMEEKKALEAELSKMKRRVEEEKDITSKLAKRNEILEQEKGVLKDEVSKAKEDKSNLDERILSKRKSVEEEKGTMVGAKKKKVSELDERIDALEAEKKALEDDLLEKDEVIKVLVMENEFLLEKKTEWERENGI